MKKIILLLVTVFVFYSCEDINHMHEEYLKDGEIVYIGKVDSIDIFPGKERVLFKWMLNADPKIDICKIYWNNRRDSTVVNVNRTQTGPFYMEEYMNLPEGEYLFEFVTEDEKGNISLSSYKSGEVYGDFYISTLRARPINEIVAERDRLTIKWGSIENSVGLVLNYLDQSDKQNNISVSPEDHETVIENYKLGGAFNYQTMFLPDTAAIDTFYSEPAHGYFPQYVKLNDSEWEIIEVSSEEAGGEGPVNGYATALIDGNLNTFWHSKWSGSSLPLPHTIVIDMKEQFSVSSIDLWRRNNNKDTKTVKYELSEDNLNWMELGEIDFPNSPNPRNRILELEELKTGRYLKLIVTESNNAPHASIAQVNVFGTPL